MEIIEDDLHGIELSDSSKFIVKRVIHTTGDFDFVETMRFHPIAVEKGLQAIREKKTIFTDVTMVAAGINRSFGHTVECLLNDEQTVNLAREQGLTRSEAAMRVAGARLNDAVVVIGNAPTALRTLIGMVNAKEVRPALIIGTPVGFVNASEAKSELATLEFPFITALGRKGGSTVAAAIVNALIKKEFSKS